MVMQNRKNILIAVHDTYRGITFYNNLHKDQGNN